MNIVTPTPTTMIIITSENIQKIINIWQNISCQDGSKIIGMEFLYNIMNNKKTLVFHMENALNKENNLGSNALNKVTINVFDLVQTTL